MSWIKFFGSCPLSSWFFQSTEFYFLVCTYFFSVPPPSEKNRNKIGSPISSMGYLGRRILILRYRSIGDVCILRAYSMWHVSFSWKHLLCTFSSLWNISVDGGFTNWIDAGACSKTCGSGNLTQTRTCTNPAPQYGGLQCQGDILQYIPCNEQICSGIPTKCSWPNTNEQTSM